MARSDAIYAHFSNRFDNNEIRLTPSSFPSDRPGAHERVLCETATDPAASSVLRARPFNRVEKKVTGLRVVRAIHAFALLSIPFPSRPRRRRRRLDNATRRSIPSSPASRRGWTRMNGREKPRKKKEREEGGGGEQERGSRRKYFDESPGAYGTFFSREFQLARRVLCGNLRGEMEKTLIRGATPDSTEPAHHNT